MRSMTGFGAGEAPLGEGRTLVEVRALNHRYLEVRTSMSAEITSHAWILEQEARKRLDRGRYDIAARIAGVTPLSPQLDIDRARIAYRSMCELRDELAPNTEVPITVLASLPNLFGTDTTVDSATVTDSLRAALDGALTDLDDMRTREGDAMRVDLTQCLERMRETHRTVTTLMASATERQRDKLRDRINQLLKDADASVDNSRLEVELAIIADRIDISEELTRLESHFAQLDNMFASTSPTGRRADFLLQEVAREVNTLSAKCQDATVSQHGVALKAEIARMRQQVQNVA